MPGEYESYGAVPEDTYGEAEEAFRSDAPSTVNKSRKWYILVATGVLAAIIAGIVAGTSHLGRHSDTPPTPSAPLVPRISMTQMDYNTTNGTFRLLRRRGGISLTTVSLFGYLGFGTVYKQEPQKAFQFGDNVWSWPAQNVQLKFGLRDTSCWFMTWSVLNTSAPAPAGFQDCFDTGDGIHWYGGGEELNQPWPLTGTGEFRPFKTHNTEDPAAAGSYGSVIHPAWVSSMGALVNVSTNVPLWVSFNSSMLCLRADQQEFESAQGAPTLTLDYTLCASDSVYDVESLFLLKNPRPSDPVGPEDSVFRNVVFTTEPALGTTFNETQLLAWAQSIQLQPNVTVGSSLQLEICEGFEAQVGDLEFDPVRFPNASAIMQQIRALGFTVSVCVHAFAQAGSAAVTSQPSNYWMRNGTEDGSPLFVDWKHGNGLSTSVAVLDITNANATAWFSQQVQALMTKYNFATVQLIGGEASLLPDGYYSTQRITTPSDYASKLAKLATSLPGSSGNVVQVGYASQDIGIGLTMSKRQRTWGADNGLLSVLTSTMVAGTLGYAFLLPDAIGGHGATAPTAELLIRWAQLSVFLPSMKFGVLPWTLADMNNVSTSAAVAAQLSRRKTLLNEIIKLASGVRNDGVPILKPLWAKSGFHNAATTTITDQFMVGDSLMVAPIVAQGQTKRDIFLPLGKWVDTTVGKRYTGPQTLKDYPCALTDTAPSFLFQGF